MSRGNIRVRERCIMVIYLLARYTYIYVYMNGGIHIREGVISIFIYISGDIFIGEAYV